MLLCSRQRCISRVQPHLGTKVKERTQELSQTLEILKATQAKLVFENALLRSAEQPRPMIIKVGVAYRWMLPHTWYALQTVISTNVEAWEFCYILNARQMGKSSLMVRMMRHLQQEGSSVRRLI